MAKKKQKKPTRAEDRHTKATQRAAAKRIKVVATADGYYEHRYLRRGDVFYVNDAAHLSSRWMARVDPETPEKITSSNEALSNERRETLANRAASKGLNAPIDNATGASDVLGDQLEAGRK